jgi:outer membrane lipoprotein-sorting protein
MSLRRIAMLPLILAVAFTLHVTAAGAQGAVPFDLAHLMARFATVKSASAQFVERRYLHFLKAPLIAKGVLIFTAPNRLEKKTLEPAAESMVVDGDTLTVQRDGQTQTLSLSAYPQIGAFIEGIRATLTGDAASLQRIYQIDLQGNASGWLLQLQPRDPAMQAVVRSISISGSRNVIDRIQTIEHDGDRTDMRITEDGR